MLRREEVISKTSSLIMSEPVKKSLFGNSLNPWIKITVKAKISYNDDQPHEMRSSSAKTMRTTDSNPLHKLLLPKLKPQGADDLEKSLSFIDPILNQAHENVEAPFDQFIENINDEADRFEASESNKENKSKAKEIIRKLFSIQEVYYHDHNKLLYENKRLKELYLKNNEKHRIVVKKINRLKELSENTDFKENLTIKVNREENRRVKQQLDLHKAELKIYRTLFGVSYNKKEIDEYTKITLNETNEKKLLLRVLENLRANNAFDTLTDERRMNANILLNKNSTTDSINGNTIDKNSGGITVSPKAESDDIEVGDTKRQKLTYVDSEIKDATDIRVDTYLTKLYGKKKLMVQIPLKRLNDGSYEYGSQKIQIKIEGDVVKGTVYLLTVSPVWWDFYTT
jgi:hypothetical protein